MNVLHLLSEYPSPHARVHGVGRFGHGLARAQAAQGDRVLVLTNSSGGAEDDVLLDGVHLHRIAFPNPPRPTDGHGEALQWNACVVARLLERREVFQSADVIVGHDWLTAVAGREAARLLDRPLVVTLHDEVIGKHLGRLDARARFVAELEALTLHDATRIVANSEYTAREAVRHYGVDPARVTAIPGGIDPTLLDVDHPEHVRDVRASLASGDELLAVYFGRLDPEKGLGVLMEAMSLVRRARADVRLVVAGTGRLESALLERLGPQDRHVGYVKGQALGYMLRAADLVVVPSVYEPFGLVALEAMAAGAAVVTSRAGGLAEIVRDGEDGLTVPPGDADALAEAVLRLAASAGLRRRFGRAASARARRDFAWTEIARRTREVYARAIAEHSTTPRRLCERPPFRPALPAVSAVLLTQDAPVRAEAALRSLVTCTVYPGVSVRVLDHGHEATANLPGVVADLRRGGAFVTLERLPGATREAARAHALTNATTERVLLVADDVEVPTGNESWLEGLVWLQDDSGAERVGPTLIDRRQAAHDASATTLTLDGEPRRRPSDPACELVRVSPLARADAGAAWTHPVRLVRAQVDPDDARGHREVGLPVSIVMVAYDGLELTRAALDAVLAHTAPPFELVLVDNGSKDGTLHLLRDVRGRLGGAVPVQVLELGANLGYPIGANRGVAVARGQHVVLLNNDTRVRPGWLEALLSGATDGSRVGVVTAKILDLDGATVQSAGGIEHLPDGGFEIPGQGEDRLAPSVTARRRVRNAGGPCMLLTRALLDELAPTGQVFDEAFSPGYFEDSDLCLRARQAGFELAYEPRAEVLHHGKATAQLVAREGRVDVWGRFEENRRRFYERWSAQLALDLAERRVDEPPSERLRILLCYHDSSTTTAAYCEDALRRDHDVVTAGRGQDLDVGRDLPEDVTAAVLVRAAAVRLGGPVDLLVVIEGETFVPAEIEHAPCRTALWAIDTHLHARKEDDPHLLLAPRFDRVFVAQKDHVETFTRRGMQASWLPLACAPEVHRQPSPGSGRDLDVVFVGHVRPFHERRRRLLDRLSRRFKVAVHEGVWREDMARLFARAKVVWNCSLAGDLNMRVFEGLASGALVVTDRIANGLGELFADGEHVRLYDDETLEQVVADALADGGAPEQARAGLAGATSCRSHDDRWPREAGEGLRRTHHTGDRRREAIAARGQALATQHHTYAVRMDTLVREAIATAPGTVDSVHVTTPYGCLGDRLCFLAAAREFARRRPELKVTTDVLPELVEAWDDGLLTTAAPQGRRAVVSAPAPRHRVKGSSPDRTYVGTYAAGLGLEVVTALRPELPALAAPRDLTSGRYVALQVLAGSAGNPPLVEELLAALLCACRSARPGWPIVLVGRPGDVPSGLVTGVRRDGLGDVSTFVRTVQHAGLVLAPRSASAHAAAAAGVPAFLWLPDDGEDWHLDYPDWPTARVTYSTPPAEAAAALSAFLEGLERQASTELQEAAS